MRGRVSWLSPMNQFDTNEILLLDPILTLLKQKHWQQRLINSKCITLMICRRPITHDYNLQHGNFLVATSTEPGRCGFVLGDIIYVTRISRMIASSVLWNWIRLVLGNGLRNSLLVVPEVQVQVQVVKMKMKMKSATDEDGNERYCF